MWSALLCPASKVTTRVKWAYLWYLLMVFRCLRKRDFVFIVVVYIVDVFVDKTHTHPFWRVKHFPGQHEISTLGPQRLHVELTETSQELRDVTQIASSHEAFCAVRADGRCVTWGGPKFGGDSSSVQVGLGQESDHGIPGQSVGWDLYYVIAAINVGKLWSDQC